jgi:hypothetical protein
MIFRTTGCAEYDHPEFTVVFDGEPLSDTSVRAILDHLQSAVAGCLRFAPGQSVALGMCLLRTIQPGDGPTFPSGAVSTAWLEPPSRVGSFSPGRFWVRRGFGPSWRRHQPELRGFQPQLHRQLRNIVGAADRNLDKREPAAIEIGAATPPAVPASTARSSRQSYGSTWQCRSGAAPRRGTGLRSRPTRVGGRHGATWEIRPWSTSDQKCRT